MKRSSLAAVFLLGSMAMASSALADGTQTAVNTVQATAMTEVRDLAVDGLSQRILYVAPAAPRATLVMLPGGAGDIGIGPDGQLQHGDNFLVRSRLLWVSLGYAVVIPDAAGSDNLRGERSSPRYAGIVGALVAFASAQNGKPVFLMGTSQGAIAAMNGASHLTKGEIAGLILTESVSRPGGSGETVFDARPDRVNVPTLVVANRDDACFVAPPADAPRIKASLTRSPDAEVLNVSGGTPGEKACGSLSPHGYFGVETQVVDAIGKWLDAHLR